MLKIKLKKNTPIIQRTIPIPARFYSPQPSHLNISSTGLYPFFISSLRDIDLILINLFIHYLLFFKIKNIIDTQKNTIEKRFIESAISLIL